MAEGITLKRIIDMDEAAELTSSDYALIDSATGGPKKFALGNELSSLKDDLNGIDDRVTALEQGGGSGLTIDIKQALLQLASKVAYIDDDGQDYYDALENALYPPAELVSISAVYTQSGTVYETDSLDSLRVDLVVTAHMSDSTTQTVTAYTLSGSLTEATSTITVSYGGKTTTFSVIVTIAQYVTDGLIAYWDGIDNTGNGHDGSATEWVDLVNNYELTLRETSHTTWDTDAVVFDGSAYQGLYCDNFWTRPTNATIEVVLVPNVSASATSVIATFDRSDSTIQGSYYDARRIETYSDGTVGFIGKSGKTYDDGVAAQTDIRKMVATYTEFTVNNAYVNGSEISLSGNTHSFTFNGNPQIRIGVENLTNASNYPFKGKIHAIRVYNKHLTAQELAKNLEYDNTRFSLGLTL